MATNCAERCWRMSRHRLTQELLPARLTEKFSMNRETGCWDWTAAKQPTGYGQVWNGKRPEQAHRVFYRLFVCEIPDGCEIDHVCRNRGCVNPDHLRAVPHKENMRVSGALMGINARKTHCKRGHELAGRNLRITPSGARQCRACAAMHARRYKSMKKALAT